MGLRSSEFWLLSVIHFSNKKEIQRYKMEICDFGTYSFCSCHLPPMLCVETSGRDFSVLYSTVIFLALTVFFHSSILQHPNVLQCIGQCVEAIPYLLVFEFCDLVSALIWDAAVIFPLVWIVCGLFNALCSWNGSFAFWEVFWLTRILEGFCLFFKRNHNYNFSFVLFSVHHVCSKCLWSVLKRQIPVPW